MKDEHHCHSMHACYRLLVVFVVTTTCAGAAVSQVTPGPKGRTPPTTAPPTKPPTTAAIIEKQTIGKPSNTSTSGRNMAPGYDYQGLRQYAGPAKPEVKSNGANIGAKGIQQLVENLGQASPSLLGKWDTPPAGLEGIWGEQYEWLRERVRRLHRHGLKDQIDVLQEKYPNVNLTLLYDHYTSAGGMYEMDDSQYHHHNGSYHWHPGYGDMEHGYVHNGTFYPGEIDGPERDESYFYNGTWHAGEQELADGFVHNGTYYREDGDTPEMEDGSNRNNTFYPGNEQEGYGKEEPEHDDLVWWQLHHPKWRDRGVNNINSNKHIVPHVGFQEPHQPLSKWNGHHVTPPPGQHQQYLKKWIGRPVTPALGQHQQPVDILTPGKIPPTDQQRLTPARPIPVHRPSAPRRPADLPLHGNMSGGESQNHQGITGRNGSPPVGSANPGVGVNSDIPGKAAMMGVEPSTHHVNPSAGSSIPPAVSWGIVLAALFGASVIIAPLVCLLYKYKQEKRIKKRTFLRRPEHGSVDDGIMDAMVMTELGEKRYSRVRQVDKEGNWRPEKHRYTGNRSGPKPMSLARTMYELQPTSSGRSKPMSLARTMYELQPVTSSSTFANIHDEPRISIT